MNIHPTRGGEAPLYSPRTPSLRRVRVRHSRGPVKREAVVVCRRTLIVSKGWPTAGVMLASYLGNKAILSQRGLGMWCDVGRHAPPLDGVKRTGKLSYA